MAWTDLVKKVNSVSRLPMCHVSFPFFSHPLFSFVFLLLLLAAVVVAAAIAGSLFVGVTMFLVKFALSCIAALCCVKDYLKRR